MKIRDILGEDDVKIEPAPANMQQATNADGKVIATGPADKMAAVQQAAKDGVDFTPGTDQQASEDYEEESDEHPETAKHYHTWMHSEHSPHSDEADDEDSVFQKAIHFLSKHGVNPGDIEYHAHHMTKKFLGGMEEGHHDLISQGNHDVGGDATDSFINQVRDKDFERAQHEGIFGFGNKSPEEWAKTSPQMATLLQFQQKYQGTPYADQIAKRIQLLKDRLDMDAGEVAGSGGAPKPVVPPDQFDMKQLKESDDTLLEKMRMIAGLR